jgi:CPA2 family monovalent cation:H+ antiporter-2
LLINEKWIAPIIGINKKMMKERSQDFDIGDHKKIIIAGYGDFGNTLGRLIKFSGFQATVLDNDSDRVDLLRKIGYTVYFGDATNPNMLKAAGAETADVLIAAIDPPETNRKLVDIVKKNYPNLKIFIRARNRFDMYDYMNEGFENVYRENFFTALHVGIDVMEYLGVAHEDAVNQGDIFVEAEKSSLIKLSKSVHNLEEYINVSRAEIDKIRKKLSEKMNAGEPGNKT